MEFTPSQQAAIAAAQAWRREKSKPFFYIGGYAGTGKTSLAQHLADENTLFASFTGKAASVMRRKGCDGASTIHSLIYLPRDKSKVHLQNLEAKLKAFGPPPYSPGMQEEIVAVQKEIQAEKLNLRRPGFTLNMDSPLRDASLLVVDECSMVDDRIGADLLSFDVPVLVLGDPGQLPPVFGAGFFTRHEPNFVLTEIHRQALDNPILRLATDAREGRPIWEGKYGSSEVISCEEFRARGRPCAPDEQILVGLNKTRNRANAARREALGFSAPLPGPGERLVCLRNNHQVGLLNGQIWNVDSAGEEQAGLFSLVLSGEEGRVGVSVHAGPFRGEELCPFTARDAEHFDWGWALTVHKAQGSEWDQVLLIDESNRFGRDARRHRYTGITRAAESLTMVLT